MKHLTITLYYITSKSQYHIYIHSPPEKRIYLEIPREAKNIYTTEINQELSSHLESSR